ncbi:MAG: bi-domain-containing oxidoreductase [Candidatus Kapabacteria bacterium]|jgi:polar amino acid transport system substrate-binding protein|nr:bi-domain-containing oxidoreductase [Candidatus Kapabacteria bacterium]
MLQVLQHQSTGEILVEELPVPSCPENGILVRVFHSLISAGTERTSVSKAQSSLLERALKQPQEVKKVLDSVRKDGITSTFRKVQNTLDSYKPLGYSVSGIVLESRCTEFSPGDRVACGGNKYAYHAEVVAVPKNLAVPVPEAVSSEEAAFTTLGAIAMQGVRQANVQLGMRVAVMGLGLLGQMTVQILKASGCAVAGLDVNEALFQTVQTLGADVVLPSNTDAKKTLEAFSHGLGVDAVIITASTDSDEPVKLAMEIVRKRGTVVVVGAVGMNIPRSPFYEKEVNFTISCSYGAGRYDPVYEEQGVDYPAGYVRWTENRNMQAFLELIAAGTMDVRTMTTHRFPLERAADAYALITGAVKERYSGIVLEYQRPETALKTAPILKNTKISSSAKPRETVGVNTIGVGVIGAGAFAQTSLLPHIQKSKSARLIAVATSTPVSAKSVAERFGFSGFGTDASAVAAHADVDLVLCASRHDSHAAFVLEALQQKKRIFVEKPLCVNEDELARIDTALEEHHSPDAIMVGFNRRFSEPFVKMREFFAHRKDPMTMVYRVNAGAIPRDSWIQDRAQGGRIVGECCHFIDCMAFLTGAVPTSVVAQTISTPNIQAAQHDTVSMTLTFSDGSLGTVHYFANGDSSLPKEYCEVFCEGAVAQMHNFTKLDLMRSGKAKHYSFGGGKGHAEEIAATLSAVQAGKPFPIDYAIIRAVTKATFAAEESLATGAVVRL